MQRLAPGRERRRLGEGHCERPVAGQPPATACQEAPDSADRVGQRRARREQVEQRTGGQPPPPNQREPHGQPEQHRPVEHEPASAYVQHIDDAVDQLGVLGHEHESGPHQPRHRHAEDHVGHTVHVEPKAISTPQHEGTAHHERQGAHGSVRVDLKPTQVDQHRMHRALPIEPALLRTPRSCYMRLTTRIGWGRGR